MMYHAACLLVLTSLAGTVSATAETLVATRTIRSNTVLVAADLATIPDTVFGALTDPDEAVGMEARVVLYAGRPVRREDIGPPAVIERNQLVSLVYLQGGLSIKADGRSLARAAAGERVRAMNLASRATVTGTVDPSGRIVIESAVADH
ncbi:flagellar basal body P-ring formation chaperone FlgA [Tropicimonas marinistellae]|uniref:flagellar basal body P-ring formation chaperone FlgA n=1 Tax=Tropicimonas marinistellae TaxID=1739787 RepID=UPI0008367543|nr:flagellar basal body P-ring formation chaperone FlgA [Tropicimonas marinistellae]